ncbi:MAG: PhoH family protein, partial [Alphaproteobacteria bacterium]|nr:PhoH family protein [Alphaproteobacteria bacterium]
MAALLFGPPGDNLARLGELLGVKITSRGGHLALFGPPRAQNAAASALKALYRRADNGLEVSAAEVEAAARLVLQNSDDADDGDGDNDTAALSRIDSPALRAGRRSITPRSRGQALALDALRRRHLVFLAGPAGTGKTYLAVAAAVSALESGAIERIILSRPAVEAGERLGFLPGDLHEKINPYLRPLHDALADFLPAETLARYTRLGTIEVAPLAFLRGRTLSSAYIILDEAQNTTRAQMMMFLTRLGEDSRMVVAGDLDQVDLPPSEVCGFADAWSRLGQMKELAAVRLEEGDVVRNPVIRSILRHYNVARPSSTTTGTITETKTAPSLSSSSLTKTETKTAAPSLSPSSS